MSLRIHYVILDFIMLFSTWVLELNFDLTDEFWTWVVRGTSVESFKYGACIMFIYFFRYMCVLYLIYWDLHLDIYISNPKKQSLSKAGWIGYCTILNIRQMFEMRIYNITTLIINIIMIQCLTCLVNRKPDNGQNCEVL